MAAPTPIVLDVDTGIDDACALLLAGLHPGLDLRAVTCVGGNAPLPQVVSNTLAVLHTAGRDDVPVAAGAERPLLAEPHDARHVHGSDGLADLDWPRSPHAPDERHAIELLRDVLRAAAGAGERVTVVPLAPMTNIALLLRAYPDVAAGIAEICFMGGAANVGNATASAEFNVFHDPEAAAVVIDACTDLDIPIRMYGLDVFYRPAVTREQAQRLIDADPTGPAGLAGRLIRFQCDRFAADSGTIGDAGAVCAVIAPEALTTRRLPVRIELGGTWSRGRTVVDLRDWTGDLAHDPHGQANTRVEVALDVDADAYVDLWLDTLLRGTP
ncbi:MAG TPA: nucleoside hydrolase [Intrasporangiaceae bacterium]|nr:nucleoside hydrolase [Intrasporangiaceae bacterium]